MATPAAIFPSHCGKDSAGSSALPARWWQSFFESSGNAQVVCRLDGVVTQMNSKAAHLFKLARAKMEGHFCLFDFLLPPAGQKLLAAFHGRHVHSHALSNVGIFAAGRQNGLMDLELASLDEAHILVTFKDISRRMRLESHVNRLVTAIDSTPDVFFLTDAGSHITFVNPAFYCVTGYSIETVLGRTDEFLRAPAEQEKVRAYREEVRRGRDWIGELINVRQDGTRYKVEAALSPICDMIGRFVGYVVCEHDITRRQQLEDDLRLQNNLVRSILHSLDGAIYSLDREFRVTHANDGWRHLSPEHGGIRLAGPPAIGRALLDYIPDAARRLEMKTIFKKVLKTGQAQSNRFEGPDGRCWLTKISPWIHADSICGLICAISNQVTLPDRNA